MVCIEIHREKCALWKVTLIVCTKSGVPRSSYLLTHHARRLKLVLRLASVFCGQKTLKIRPHGQWSNALKMGLIPNLQCRLILKVKLSGFLEPSPEATKETRRRGRGRKGGDHTEEADKGRRTQTAIKNAAKRRGWNRLHEVD